MNSLNYPSLAHRLIQQTVGAGSLTSAQMILQRGDGFLCLLLCFLTLTVVEFIAKVSLLSSWSQPSELFKRLRKR